MQMHKKIHVDIKTYLNVHNILLLQCKIAPPKMQILLFAINRREKFKTKRFGW